MKKIRYKVIIVLLFTLIFQISGSVLVIAQNCIMTVSTTTLDVNAEGSGGVVYIQPTWCDYNVYSNDSWITVWKDEYEGYVMVNTEVNEGWARTGSVIIDDYYTITVNQAGCAGPSAPVINVESPLCAERNVFLTVDPVENADGYYWEISGGSLLSDNGLTRATIGFGSGTSVVISVTPYNQCGYGEVSTKQIFLERPSSAILNQTDKNFIISNTILIPGITNSCDVYSLTSDNLQQTISYFDGLGRPMQSVSWQASPLRKDIVQPIVYDAFGREDKKYLPFTKNNDGVFKADAITEQASFYKLLGFTTTELPYAQTVFENSPLNRVLQQGAPGADWQPAAGHAVGLDYLTNTIEEVALYKVIDDGSCAQNGFYSANELYVTQTIDENKHPVREYKDKQGNVVLKSVSDGTIWLQTYYVYDDLGLLRFVLPPKAVQKLNGIPDDATNMEVVSSN